MAEKYGWRKENQSNETQSKEKTYGWREDAKKASISTVGETISSRVNTWLKNHNTYLSNYKSRYEGRKGGYDDDFVSDSGDWLDTVSKQKENFKLEAESILSYVDQYKDYLGADFVNNVRKTLSSGIHQQSSIIDSATKDNEWWNSFNDKDLLDEYGSAEEAYKANQRKYGYQKTYEGMTSDELSKIIDSLEDGEEKKWLTDYKPVVEYEENSKLDTNALQKEIEEMENVYKKAESIVLNYGHIRDIVGADDADADADLQNQIRDVLGGFRNGEYATMEDLEKTISQKRQKLTQASRVQEGIKLSGVADETSEYYDPEFSTKTGYVSTKSDKWHSGLTSQFGMGYDDLVYEYINGSENGMRDEIIHKVITYDYDPDDYYIYDHMTEAQKDLYNYYYKEGGKESAERYLDSIHDALTYQEAKLQFEKKKGKTGWELLYGIEAGVDQFQSGFKNFFNTKDDYIPASTTQVVSGMIREDLGENSGAFAQGAYDFITTTANMAPSILASTAIGVLNPTAGMVAGNALMGTSAAGNAYQDAINRGYGKAEARTYSTLIGASEIALGSVLGGISKLGGVSSKLAKAVAGIDNGLLRFAAQYGGKIASEGLEEGLQEILDPIFQNAILHADEEVDWGEVAYSALLGGLSAGFMEGVGTAVQVNKEQRLKKAYNGNTAPLIQEGLGSDVNSESYELATQYKAKTDSGKTLTGAEIRQLLAANQEQITSKDLKLIQQAAAKRLTDLGQTENVEQIAELATKFATGQNLTRSERSILARSEYGSQVSKDLLPENIEANYAAREWAKENSAEEVDDSSSWAENIGTRMVNFDAYNKDKIKAREAFEEMLKKAVNGDPNAYKSLEERVGTESSLSVSESGKATIHESGKEIDLKKAEVVNFVQDKNTGKITDMTMKVDGEEVKASGIEYSDDSQSYLFEAVPKIENITPGAATHAVQSYDPASGLSVSEYLNGFDEAYTYGYNKYSEADLKAGKFAPKLSEAQMMDAYRLGQSARNISRTAKTEAIKKMRTAAQAEAEKAVAEGKEAPKAKKMTISYDEGGGKVSDIDSVKHLSAKQKAGVAVAKVLHQMGLGTNFEFYASKLSKTLKDEDGNPVRVFINENGVEEAAPSGVYRKSDGTIRIDLNAYNGHQMTLNAMSHELTHFIQQWSDEKYQVLVDFLIETYEKTDMTMHQRVLREQARLESIRKEDVSYQEAYDEVVANAMSKMLDDGKVMERMAELRAKDEEVANKLVQGIRKLLNKFFKIFSKESALFWDAHDLMQMKETFEKLQNIFAEALVEASDNFQTYLTASESQSLTEAGIGFDESTQSVYSLHFSNAYTEQIQVGKKTFDTEAITRLVAKATDRSITDARKWVQSEMAIANIVMQNPEFLDFEADNRYEAIKKNSDYPQGTVDLSNLCPKREEFTTMFDMLQKKYPNKLFTAQDVADMRKILSDNDITVACGACFVEDRRQLIGEIADTFIGMWKEAAESGKPLQKTNAAGNKIELQVTKALAKQYGLAAGTKIMATDTYIPNQYDLTTYEGFKKLEKNHPTIAMAFNRYNNSRGQQSARLIEGRAEYKRQILGWSDAKVKSVNNNGGLRIFSFSDFEVVHLLDLVQVIIDCAAKGVKIQGYTKIPAFAKLVRDTGIKLNRSLIPKGDYGYHMENGKVVLDYDTTEGIDINDKNFIDERDNPNVGNIVIGINPTQIGAAMLDSFVDYIIPFHSNKAKEILRKLGTGEWVNYKESQHEKDIATGTSSKHNVNIYTEVLNKYHPTNKVEFVEAFLKECKRQGKIPRYAEFLNVDANGDYAYREGYHKLLVDFKMFDAEGNILPQGNITPNLNEAFMKELLNAEIDRKQNYEFPQEVYNAIDKKFGEQYSSQQTDIDTAGEVNYDNENVNLQEVNGNARQEESREAFYRRAHEKKYTVRERGQIACGYTSVANKTRSAGQAERNLKKLGIKAIVHEGLEANVNGITRVILGDATSVAGDAVYVRNSIKTDPVETAGHEAFHFWKHSDARIAYKETIVENIVFSSDEFIQFQKEIADAYFGEEIGLDDDGADKLTEEIFAYITGLIHAGDSKNIVRSFLRDYDAVKSAWDDMVKKQTVGIGKDTLYSSQETDADIEGNQFVTYKDAIANISKYSDSDLRSIAAQITDGTYSFAKNMPRESMENVLRGTLAILAKDDPTQTVRISNKKTPSTAKVSQGKPNIAINSKKDLVLKLRELHQEIGDRNKSMNNVAQNINGVQKLWEQLDKGEITVQQYDEQLRVKSPYYRELFDQAQKLQSDFDGLVKELEEIEGKPWKSLRSDVLYGSEFRYSTQETDNISNRDLLANAFEGISQNSTEYKMIQDYKGRIKILNEYEAKLSELNAEIRKITFGTEGERDSKRLKELHDEAKKVAENINRNDKRLLSLEASEPLRKVIDRERKKEAQKTKEHVQEIQQNKKLRAEQTELRHKIRRTIRDLDKILNRGNKKQNVKEDMQNVVSTALKAADILFTENYGNYDMLRNGIKTDMSDAEEALVATCTRMLKDFDKMPTDGYENWQARQEAENRLRTKMSKLKEVFARERKRLNNTTVSSILGELADAYGSLEDSTQSYVQGAYSEPVHNFLKSLQKEVGGTIVSDMTKNQLESVYAAYQMVLTTVRKANQMFNEELKESREQLGNAVIEEVLKAGGVHLLGTKMGDKISRFDWNNTKPIWLANRIGSDTFGKLMNGLFKGQYNFAVDVDETKQFKLNMDEKYHPRNWDTEKLYKFESSTGKEFNLNLQQIMSLYAFSKREQAHSHLLNGGFVFEDNSTVVVDGKLGIKKTYIYKGATSYKLNEATLNSIVNSLTAEQKAYVDEMQKYLSETMGAKGNEVSMKLYGIQMFKEKFYFPLRSSGAYLERAKEAELKKQQGQINLVNSGFTHSVKPEAKNPIVLSNFMDVWAEHCNEMSMYHSMVLPMEDFRKVYNYSTIHDAQYDSASVFQTIQDAYGKEATDYIDQLYRELNAGATVDPLETDFKALISNFKKAAVMLSGSVVLQQFSSIGRAYAVIDPKYFVGGKVNSDTKLSAVEEMKKYAPVAIIKEMGGFDTGTKGNAKAYIMAEKYGKGERIKGLLTDKQYRGDLMGYLPAKADEKTWSAIWEAAKRETKAKHPKMDVRSEEFLKLAGERFSEVIEKTQVYDSVLARSANMRSKGTFMQMATAFMAEPTTTINLIEDAIRSGNTKKIARTFGSVAVSILLNNALASVVYAMRDDDEDETFIEKYFQSFTSGLIDDINPMSYYPFLKDVYALFQGYDVERSDMSVIADVRDALKKTITLIGKDTSEMDDDKLAEHWKNVNSVLLNLLDAGFSMFGVPVKNVRRDVNGIINAWNTIHSDLTERDTTWRSFWDKVGAAAKDTVPIYAFTKGREKGDKLYEAIISGDKAYVGRLKSTYKTEDSYHSAVRTGLRENDPRIKEAAQAHINGDPSERVRIAKLIKADGFDQDDVVMAINAEINAMTKDDSSSSDPKAKGMYKVEDFVREAANGDTVSLGAIREDILQTAQKNGKTEKEAEKDFVSDVKSEAKKAYLADELSDSAAETILLQYAELDEEEATAKINYWAFIKDHPDYDYLNESQVNKFHEFAEPAEIPLDVFAQYVEGTKDIKTIKDEWGDEVLSARDQVLDFIDSLDLTWQQKDALYLAHGYAESKIWDVPW